ncbi:cell division topological specificity factor MinE [Clostridium oryzae]|uniref:Cell division topological specificity factor n=1 Tax=Clostridium oryzae TaxID=1450648 RepID=A0A1V4IUM8_9CLOT|nr:cell division topological specificity factor MinE [Clostridium oryzae]OPJ63758.1 cell division topological specificity factor [Clostridium oryzae]
MDLLKMLGINRTSSKDIAKDRLRLILINDRAALSPDVIDNIKREILDVISKYVEIDNSEVEIELTKTNEDNGNFPALVANIPIRKAKSR